jgi:hypothetical protein
MLFVLCTVKWITESVIANKCRRIRLIVKYTIYRTVHLLVLIELMIKDRQFFSSVDVFGRYLNKNVGLKSAGNWADSFWLQRITVYFSIFS